MTADEKARFDAARAKTNGGLTPTAPKLAHVSASQLKTFRRCNRRWHHEKIGGHRSPDTKATLRGKAVHTVLERYLLSGEVPPDTDEGRIAAPALLMLPPPGVPKDCVERKLTDDSYPVPMLGFIDLLEPDLRRVTDHKTSSAWKYAKTEDELARDVQAQVYAAEALRLWGPGPVTFRHVVMSTRSPEARETQVTLEEADILAARDRIVETIHSMKATAALPVEDTEYNLSACADYGGCPHKARCAATGLPTMGGLSTLFANVKTTTEEAPVSNPTSFMARLLADKAAAAETAPPGPSEVVSKPHTGYRTETPKPEPATAAVAETPEEEAVEYPDGHPSSPGRLAADAQTVAFIKDLNKKFPPTKKPQAPEPAAINPPDGTHEDAVIEVVVEKPKVKAKKAKAPTKKELLLLLEDADNLLEVMGQRETAQRDAIKGLQKELAEAWAAHGAMVTRAAELTAALATRPEVTPEGAVVEVRQARVLYVGCVPLGISNYEMLDLAPYEKRVCDQLQVPHLNLAPYGEGPKVLAALVATDPNVVVPEVAFLDRKHPGADLLVHALRKHFDIIVRGLL